MWENNLNNIVRADKSSGRRQYEDSTENYNQLGHSPDEPYRRGRPTNDPGKLKKGPGKRDSKNTKSSEPYSNSQNYGNTTKQSKRGTRVRKSPAVKTGLSKQKPKGSGSNIHRGTRGTRVSLYAYKFVY